MFRGVYNNYQKHQRDLDTVLERSWHHGLEKIIITVGTINDLPEAVKIAQNDGTIEFIYFVMNNLISNFTKIHRANIFHNGVSSNTMRGIWSRPHCIL